MGGQIQQSEGCTTDWTSGLRSPSSEEAYPARHHALSQPCSFSTGILYQDSASERWGTLVLENCDIMSRRFLIQYKELSSDMAPSQKQMVMMEKKKYIIPTMIISRKTLNIPSGGTSYTFDNVFRDKLPDSIALAVVADAAPTGKDNANPFTFQNFCLNYIAQSCNLQLMRHIHLEPNFATEYY